ncbi:MAG: helix-turn-helix domain-containing protein [Clostridia bacterium]|nr:helix-turn-helix domain-containing protein [Clostridia bacterium]
MENLRLLRKNKNISMKELGKIIGVAESTISLYENGKRQPDNKTLLSLANYFEVSIDYLLGRSEIKKPSNIYTVDGIISFEVLGSVKAGYDGAFDEIPTGETIELPLSMVSGGQKEDYFVLQVKGDSMHPRLLDGDKILCKRTTSVDSGTLAVIAYNGDEATIKKVNYVYGEDWLELIPFNPEYATKRIEGRDLEQCHVVGKVVKLIRDL